tara:strand:+ start:145 stop:1143 length:999 start_codon:yes stop_codon:yes gene_type:complete
MSEKKIVINRDKIILLIFKKFKKIINFGLISSLVFVLYFIFSTPNYKGSVSFYAHYSESISIDQGYLSSIAALAGQNNDLVFSISDLIESKKFLNEIVNENYIIDGEEVSLIDFYDSVYNSNILMKILKYNKTLMMNNILSEDEIKSFLARDKLKDDISFVENRISKIYTVTVDVENDPVLAEQLINNIYNSILSYSNEVVNVKALEKKDFISERLKEVKISLEFSEKKYIDFLNKNKSLSSPNLIIQKQGIEREINLYNQLFLNLSDQLELAKIEEKNNTSSFFLLDKPQVSDLRSGISFLMGIVLFFVLGAVLCTTHILFKKRNDYLDLQ